VAFIMQRCDRRTDADREAMAVAKPDGKLDVDADNWPDARSNA